MSRLKNLGRASYFPSAQSKSRTAGLQSPERRGLGEGHVGTASAGERLGSGDRRRLRDTSLRHGDCVAGLSRDRGQRLHDRSQPNGDELHRLSPGLTLVEPTCQATISGSPTFPALNSSTAHLRRSPAPVAIPPTSVLRTSPTQTFRALSSSTSPKVKTRPAVRYGIGRDGRCTNQLVATGTATLYGYLAQWKTTAVPNGTYQLTSLASYAGGISGSSPPITITVSN